MFVCGYAADGTASAVVIVVLAGVAGSTNHESTRAKNETREATTSMLAMV